MELLEAINTRRSVRSYADTKVDKETIEKLILAATQAPSAMNTQPWAYAVIQDAALLKDYSDRAKLFLLKSLDRIPLLTKYKAAFENPGFNIFYNAQSLVIIFAKAEGLHNAEDCCLAAQNLMLTAHNLGLGTCWIGFARPFLNLPDVKEELRIPADYETVAPIIVGYPQINPPAVPKKSPEIIFWK
jgi:nitroreductase